MKMSEDDFDAVVATNLKGAFQLCEARFPPDVKAEERPDYQYLLGFRRHGECRPGHHCASKAGAHRPYKIRGQELGSRGITSNAVAPGFIHTEMTDVLPDDVKKRP